MVEYGLILSLSLDKFIHRLSYDHSLQMTAILIIAAILLVIYGICKL